MYQLTKLKILELSARARGALRCSIEGLVSRCCRENRNTRMENLHISEWEGREDRSLPGTISARLDHMPGVRERQECSVADKQLIAREVENGVHSIKHD